jgi:hypothetical protein
MCKPTGTKSYLQEKERRGKQLGTQVNKKGLNKVGRNNTIILLQFKNNHSLIKSPQKNLKAQNCPTSN